MIAEKITVNSVRVADKSKHAFVPDHYDILLEANVEVVDEVGDAHNIMLTMAPGAVLKDFDDEPLHSYWVEDEQGERIACGHINTFTKGRMVSSVFKYALENGVRISS